MSSEVSSEIDVAGRGEAGTEGEPTIPGPAAAPSGEGVPASRGGLGGLLGAVARRDILGVNAAVLAVLLLPLLFGFYAKVHWGYLFPPDSRYYITMTLRDMGYSDATALTKQVQLTGSGAESWYFAHSDPVWLLVQPRMLYPLLSVPFVWLFGLRTGMIVVPMIALAAAVFASTRLVQRLYGPFAALAAGGMLAAGGAMVGLAEAITDPLAITIIALILLNLPIGRRAQGHNLVFLALLSVLMCLTRQAMPMVVGMAAGGWLWAAVFPGKGRPRRIRNEWFVPSAIVVGITLAGQVVGSILAPYNVTQQFLYASNEPTLGHAIKDLPDLAWRMTRIEVLGMIQNDRFLLILMAAPLVYLLVRFTDAVVGLFVGGLVGTYALIIANGVPSGMRYESILFPIAALALGALVHRFAPEALRGGSVGTGVLPSTGLDTEPSWWQGGRRRVPGLAAASALALVGIVGWSATHGSSSMVGAVPTVPAAAAALAGSGHEVIPGGNNPASRLSSTAWSGVPRSCTRGTATYCWPSRTGAIRCAISR